MAAGSRRILEGRIIAGAGDEDDEEKPYIRISPCTSCFQCSFYTCALKKRRKEDDVNVTM